jgi:hypothetical protein
MGSSHESCHFLKLFKRQYTSEPIGFTHIWGEVTDNVDWTHISNSITFGRAFAVLESNREDSESDYTYAALRERGVSDANILVYNQGKGEGPGRTCGIDSDGVVGEFQTGAIVYREKGPQLDSALSHYITKNSGQQATISFHSRLRNRLKATARGEGSPFWRLVTDHIERFGPDPRQKVWQRNPIGRRESLAVLW